MTTTRPTEEQADAAITAHLTELYGEDCPHFHKCEDGDDGWAFWIWDRDTTSYVHEDCRIEWYGTNWTPGADEEDEAA